jgi:hypothetical protein
LLPRFPSALHEITSSPSQNGAAGSHSAQRLSVVEQATGQISASTQLPLLHVCRVRPEQRCCPAVQPLDDWSLFGLTPLSLPAEKLSSEHAKSAAHQRDQKL